MSVANKGLVVLCVGLVACAGLAAACGDDDTGTTTSSSSSGSGTSTSSSSSGTSGTSSSSSSSSSTSGAIPDAGTDTGSSGGLKKNGETCSAAKTGNAECQSGHCEAQNGGATVFCTVLCTAGQNSAPECTDAVFTGKCTGQGFCQKK